MTLSENHGAILVEPPRHPPCVLFSFVFDTESPPGTKREGSYESASSKHFGHGKQLPYVTNHNITTTKSGYSLVTSPAPKKDGGLRKGETLLRKKQTGRPEHRYAQGRKARGVRCLTSQAILVYLFHTLHTTEHVTRPKFFRVLKYAQTRKSSSCRPPLISTRFFFCDAARGMGGRQQAMAAFWFALALMRKVRTAVLFNQRKETFLVHFIQDQQGSRVRDATTVVD